MKIAFTICSANYLPFAKSLADSLIQTNPDYRFIIALADTYQDFDNSFFAPHQIVSVPEMQLPHFEELNNKYNIFELSCALKPFVAQALLSANEQCSSIFYFDADILVYGKLAAAEAVLTNHFLVLTPHIATPQKQDSINTELDVLRTGLYNAGFFGLQKCSESFAFLQWWQERLQHYCFNDARNGLFVDQLWLNLAPVYFQKTCILFDPGYNLAYWNFTERKLTIEDNGFVVNKQYPLVFFHFSGYDIQQPDSISKHQKTYNFENVPEYAPLFQDYREAAEKNKAEEFFSIMPGLGKPPLPVVIPEKRKGFLKRTFYKLLKKEKHP